MVLETISVLGIFGVAATLLAHSRHSESQRPSARPEPVNAYLDLIKDNIRLVNEASSMSVKLSRIDYALKAASGLARLRPHDATVSEQIRHLKDVQTSLHNEALRQQMDRILGQMRGEPDLAQKQHLGGGLIQYLDNEDRHQLVDRALIAHYRDTVQKYLDELKVGAALDRPTPGIDNWRESIRSVLGACHSSLDVFVETDVPDHVRFFDRAELKIRRLQAAVE